MKRSLSLLLLIGCGSMADHPGLLKDYGNTSTNPNLDQTETCEVPVIATWHWEYDGGFYIESASAKPDKPKPDSGVQDSGVHDTGINDSGGNGNGKPVCQNLGNLCLPSKISVCCPTGIGVAQCVCTGNDCDSGHPTLSEICACATHCGKGSRDAAGCQ